jgi:hypothetical protein
MYYGTESASSVKAWIVQSVYRLGYGLDDRDSIPVLGKKLFSIASRPALRPT